MYGNKDQIIVLFVSTGRCGTTRLAEILKKQFYSENIRVCHQMKFSRVGNVIGNLMYFFGSSEWIKEKLFRRVLSKNDLKNDFISSDPLTSMVIPKSILNREKTYIVHIYRKPWDFGKSFYRYSRSRPLSFIAHNFIPFWQLYLWPIENWMKGEKVVQKYKIIGERKAEWFRSQYGKSSNFRELSMQELFNTNELSKVLSEIFLKPIEIDLAEFKKKSNQS